MSTCTDVRARHTAALKQLCMRNAECRGGMPMLLIRRMHEVSHRHLGGFTRIIRRRCGPIWAVRAGQFDDPDGAAARILIDEDRPAEQVDK